MEKMSITCKEFNLRHVACIKTDKNVSHSKNRVEELNCFGRKEISKKSVSALFTYVH